MMSVHPVHISFAALEVEAGKPRTCRRCVFLTRYCRVMYFAALSTIKSGEKAARLFNSLSNASRLKTDNQKRTHATRPLAAPAAASATAAAGAASASAPATGAAAAGAAIPDSAAAESAAADAAVVYAAATSAAAASGAAKLTCPLEVASFPSLIFFPIRLLSGRSWPNGTRLASSQAGSESAEYSRPNGALAADGSNDRGRRGK